MSETKPAQGDRAMKYQCGSCGEEYAAGTKCDLCFPAEPAPSQPSALPIPCPSCGSFKPETFCRDKFHLGGAS